MTNDPRIFQAIVIRRALELYKRTGIKANRAYTPTNMMRTAAAITGKKFLSRDYMGAAQALGEWIEAQGEAK